MGNRLRRGESRLAVGALAGATVLFSPAVAQDQHSPEQQLNASAEALAETHSGDAEAPGPDDEPSSEEDLGALAAADAAIGERQVYTPEDFARYAPRTALDMVQQVPGFAIDRENNRARGLGQASGNVLINGERLASKSEGARDQLARMAASDVLRIEIVDGSTLNVPGLSGQVANIVVTNRGGVTGQFDWEPQLAARYSRTRWMDINASVTGKTGRLGWTLAVDQSPFYGGSGGPNIITFGSGRIEERFSRSQTNGREPRISTRLRYDTPGGAIGNFNAAYQWNRFRSMEDEFVVVPAGLPSQIERIRTRDRGYNYEIGGDFEFALGPGRLKLIGLESYETGDFRTQSVIDPDTGVPPFGTRFTLDSASGEHIGRAEYSWAMLGGDWQLSAEAAFNRLDQFAGLFALSPAGEFYRVPFPAGTGGVTEDRYESMLSFGRPITSSLSFQLAVGGEYSRIAQTGSNALARTFLRPKGSLSLAWAPADGLDFSLKLERRVGQLDFSDFLAEIDLADDNANAGNNDLRPDQRWALDLEVNKALGPWGSLHLRAFRRWITDYVTVVPLPGGGESTGNVDSARISGVELIGTVRLDPLGLRGAKFDLEGQMRESGFEDPVTGRTIPVLLAQPRNIEIEFRHDVPGSDFAYGGSFRKTRFNPYYRTAEFGYDHNISDNAGLFVEHKDVFGLTVQARVNNLLEKETVLDRTIYSGLRGSSPILFSEFRVREIGKVVSFSVKGSF